MDRGGYHSLSNVVYIIKGADQMRLRRRYNYIFMIGCLNSSVGGMFALNNNFILAAFFALIGLGIAWSAVILQQIYISQLRSRQ